MPFAALAAAGGLLEWQQAPAPIRSVVASPAVRDFNAPFAELCAGPDQVVAAAHSRSGSHRCSSRCGPADSRRSLSARAQWRAIRAAVRASTPWAAATPVPADIEIRTAPTVLEPGVVGLRRPVILLPEGIDTYLTAGQFAAVLAHEVCHVRRRDNLTAAIHMLVEALFWFHPMVWWIGARLVADPRASVRRARRRRNGRTDCLRRRHRHRLPALCGDAAHERGRCWRRDIKARIDAILANRIGLRLTLSKRLVLAAVAVLSLTVPIVTGAIEAAAFAAGQLPGGAAGAARRSIRSRDSRWRRSSPSTHPADARGSRRRRAATTSWVCRCSGVAQAIGGSSGPHHRPAGLDRYRALHHCRQGPRRCPSERAAGLMTNLLKDRFKLVTHRETRELPVYNLVFARNDKRFGPAFKETSAECRAMISARLEAAQRGGPAPAAPPDPAAAYPITAWSGIASFKGASMATIANGSWPSTWDGR